MLHLDKLLRKHWRRYECIQCRQWKGRNINSLQVVETDAKIYLLEPEMKSYDILFISTKQAAEEQWEWWKLENKLFPALVHLCQLSVKRILVWVVAQGKTTTGRMLNNHR